MLRIASFFHHKVVGAAVVCRVDVLNRPKPVVAHDWPAGLVAEVVVAVREDVRTSDPVCYARAVKLLIVPPRIEQNVLVRNSFAVGVRFHVDQGSLVRLAWGVGRTTMAWLVVLRLVVVERTVVGRVPLLGTMSHRNVRSSA